MKQILTALILVLVPVLAVAAGGGGQLDNMEPDLSDKASLQRGAKIFTNNCMGCHSAQYARYKGLPRTSVSRRSCMKRTSFSQVHGSLRR